MRSLLRASALALVVTVPACGGGGGGACRHGFDAQTCVDRVNALRATVGLAALGRWTAGEACADAQAASDSVSGVAHGAFGNCGERAQDECPGWGALSGASGIVPGCLDLMWAEGPGGGHYRNMTGSYGEVACGFHVTANGAVWAVQDFR